MLKLSLLIFVFALAACKKSNEDLLNNPDNIAKQIFRTKGTRDFYKIKSITETRAAKQPPEKMGDLTSNGSSRTMDIDVELTKDCYNPMGIKADILPVCSSTGEASQMKKAGEVASLKNVDVAVATVTGGPQEETLYSLSYKDMRF